MYGCGCAHFYNRYVLRLKFSYRSSQRSLPHSTYLPVLFDIRIAFVDCYAPLPTALHTRCNSAHRTALSPRLLYPRRLRFKVVWWFVRRRTVAFAFSTAFAALATTLRFLRTRTTHSTFGSRFYRSTPLDDTPAIIPSTDSAADGSPSRHTVCHLPRRAVYIFWLRRAAPLYLSPRLILTVLYYRARLRDKRHGVTVQVTRAAPSPLAARVRVRRVAPVFVCVYCAPATPIRCSPSPVLL